MADNPPTSILLPTVVWNPVIRELADQLGSNDELLVICDSQDDPVAKRTEEFPDGVRLIVAGEPEGCSGKANAIVAGMEAARHDRLVWTDDDFLHPASWLADLHGAYDRHGPSSELPFFIGQNPLAALLEPIFVYTGVATVYLSDIVWAGSVIFERDDLSVDEDEFRKKLSDTVSDDGLLSEYLDVTSLRRSRLVETSGGIRATLERHVRLTKIFRYHAPRTFVVVNVVWTLIAAVCILYPLWSLVALTALTACTYAIFGIRRWTALLAYPAFLMYVPLSMYALLRRTFVWSGRRYRWKAKFDVSITSEE